LGVYDALKASTTSAKIMNEPYYDPNKLDAVLVSYRRVFDDFKKKGVVAVELDNMDFYQVNKERGFFLVFFVGELTTY
jgi:hypothetical protein